MLKQASATSKADVSEYRVTEAGRRIVEMLREYFRHANETHEPTKNDEHTDES